MEKKVLGIIVTYYPEEQLLRTNVEAIAPYIDKLVIWENTRENKEAYRYVEGDNIEYLSEGQNIGISKALNIGWRKAQNEGFDYILTMDQDSRFTDFVNYLKTSVNYSNSKPAIFGPMVTRDETTISRNSVRELEDSQYLITSGMLVHIDILESIGGYCEDFKVDGIDVDLCVRAQEKGFKIYQNSNGVLLQHFGEPYVRRFMGKEYVCPNYSPFRLYGIMRNHLIIYRRSHRVFVKRLAKIYFFHFVPRIVLWEKEKTKKLWNIIKGIYDGLTYRL